MKRKFTLISLILLIFTAGLLNGQGSREIIYSVVEVYTSSDIENGDTIDVVGYYTNTDFNLMVEFYGDFNTDEVFAEHTVLTLTAMTPAPEAWNGGYIIVNGKVTFQPETDPFYPGDSLHAYLEAFSITVVLPGDGIPANAPGKKNEGNPVFEPGEGGSGSRNGCDPCKFAFLLSGGVNALNNHSKYWENLVALYKFKVDSLGYCDSNVFVHYYHGTPRDGRIPAGRVIKADSAKIDSTHALIARRVAACTANGTPATFQKMITNHGSADGGIDLLGDETMTPEHLRDIQQPIIDSCCSTVYDEFIQCYGGNSVDAVSEMNTRNKATIYANSNASNSQTGASPHGQVHPYLQGKINTLDTGGTYGQAVVNGKLAYDAYLQQLVNRATNQIAAWKASPPGTPDRAAEIAAWTADSAKWASRICTSRNVTIVPFTNYCQWKSFVVPPGGQLKTGFAGNSNSCGNVTVYKVDPATGRLVKVRVWNWNHPGSARYVPGNEQRVINGDPDGSTTFWIHNDNDTSRLRVEALGGQILPESPPNVFAYPGFSFGGTDNSSAEFVPIPVPNYFLENIEQLPLPLDMLPSWLGPGFVQQFGFSFQVSPTDEYWTNMNLILRILQVANPNVLMIQLFDGNTFSVNITQPGNYVVPLGDFSLGGPFSGITMVPMGGMQIELDSWGFRSGFVPVPLLTTWLGEVSSDWNDPLNWSDGVPGPNHEVTILPFGIQPVILFDVSIKSITLMEGASVITAPGAVLIVTGD